MNCVFAPRYLIPSYGQFVVSNPSKIAWSTVKKIIESGLNELFVALNML